MSTEMINKFHLTTLFNIARGLLIIYAALWIGKLLSNLSGELLPASIVGMLLLCAALQLGVIKLHWVETSAKLFVRWMSLLFVPISVALVNQLDTLLAALPAMLATCLLGTWILLVAVGWVYQRMENKS